MIAQCRPDAGSDRVGIGIGVDQYAALRVFGGDLPVGVAQVLMKLQIFRSNRSRTPLPGSGRAL